MGAFQIHYHYAFVKPCKQQYSIGSYSPRFISRSGRESVSDSATTCTSASLGGLVVCIHVLHGFVHYFKALSDAYLFFLTFSKCGISVSCVEQVTAVLILCLQW